MNAKPTCVLGRNSTEQFDSSLKIFFCLTMATNLLWIPTTPTTGFEPSTHMLGFLNQWDSAEFRKFGGR